MKKQIYSLLILLSVTIFQSLAQSEGSLTVAKQFWYAQTGEAFGTKNLESYTAVTDKNFPAFTVYFDRERPGFVMVSESPSARPILGYSFNNHFSSNDMPAHVQFWYESMAKGIERQTNHDPEGLRYRDEWAKYLIGHGMMPARKTMSVGPYTENIIWNQNQGWNMAFPNNSQGERAVAGCVATAMGIIMKYHAFPQNANGFYRYTTTGYNEQSVDFSNAEYVFGLMSNTAPTYGASELMYHAAVSVQMQFGTDESSAYMADIQDALWFYFLYERPQYLKRINYIDQTWYDLIKTELNEARPVLYAGDGETGGHAFVCDGYDIFDRFHVNFGWGGYNNGFYDFSSQSFLFPENHEVMIGIEPDYSFDAKDERNAYPWPDTKPETETIQVFPNPVRDVFYLSPSDDVLRLKMYDSQGRLVTEYRYADAYSTAGLQNGFYILEILTSGGIMRKAIIKN